MMTALATCVVLLVLLSTQHTPAVVDNACTFIQAAYNRMHSGCWCQAGASSQLPQSPLALFLTSKFDFSEHPGPGMVPGFSGQACV